MTPPPIPAKPILKSLIIASAGTPRNYRISFWGQLIMGSLYSFGLFNIRMVGLIIGFILPVIWVIATYRLLKAKARIIPNLPFPGWMKKDPGNALVIIMDIVFLALIWFFILSGVYTASWLKLLFTIFFPLLTLAMLKNLILIQPPDEEKKEGQPPANQQPPAP